MIEIDVLPASNETKGADSILLRFGTFSYDSVPNKQTVILIDGGYKENAENIKKHLDSFYDTKTIDLLICTHPDADHINGLLELLNDEKIIINKALVHNPWKFKYAINRKSNNDKTTPNSIEKRLEKSLSSLDDLLSKLDERKINTEFPFSGHTEFNGIIRILGPSDSYYTSRVAEFPGMPNYVDWVDNYKPEIVEYDENMNHFLDEVETSARNASSAIVLFEYEGFKTLFTGDAGVESIECAIDYAVKNNINLKNLNYFQLPHHGSIKNISKKITDKIIAIEYFVSAPSNSEDHPSKLLLNYFQYKLNKKVFHVSKNILCISKNAPSRNWNTAESVPKYNKVQLLIKK